MARRNNTGLILGIAVLGVAGYFLLARKRKPGEKIAYSTPGFNRVSSSERAAIAEAAQAEYDQVLASTGDEDAARLAAKQTADAIFAAVDPGMP